MKLTKDERERLQRRLAYMLHGPGRPSQHASDYARDKWSREVNGIRERLRYKP